MCLHILSQTWRTVLSTWCTHCTCGEKDMQRKRVCFLCTCSRAFQLCVRLHNAQHTCRQRLASINLTPALLWTCMMSLTAWHTLRMESFSSNKSKRMQRVRVQKQLEPCAHSAEPVLRRGRASCSLVASLPLWMVHVSPVSACRERRSFSAHTDPCSHNLQPYFIQIMNKWRHHFTTRCILLVIRGQVCFSGAHVPVVNITT